MKSLWLLVAVLMAPSAAWASGLDRCEIVVLDEIVDEDGGRLTTASYRSAEPFLAGVFDPTVPVTRDDEGELIRGLLCERNDLVPTERDYAVLSTGIPLSLSQDFDSPDSDILTVYYDERAFVHKYTSDYPMSEEFETAVVSTLRDFSARDHGLVRADTNKSAN
jgi:hypothetical protein